MSDYAKVKGAVIHDRTPGAPVTGLGAAIITDRRGTRPVDERVLRVLKGPSKSVPSDRATPGGESKG